MSKNAPYEIASVLLKGPISADEAAKINDKPDRLNTRAVKLALARSQQGGIPVGETADDLVAAGFSRDLVAADLTRRLPLIDGDSELTAAGKAAVKAEIAAWLAKGGAK